MHFDKESQIGELDGSPVVESLLPTKPERAYHKDAVSRRGSCSTHVYNAVIGCHSTEYSIPFFFNLTPRSNIVQPAAFELRYSLRLR